MLWYIIGLKRWFADYLFFFFQKCLDFLFCVLIFSTVFLQWIHWDACKRSFSFEWISSTHFFICFLFRFCYITNNTLFHHTAKRWHKKTNRLKRRMLQNLRNWRWRKCRTRNPEEKRFLLQKRKSVQLKKRKIVRLLIFEMLSRRKQHLTQGKQRLKKREKKNLKKSILQKKKRHDCWLKNICFDWRKWRSSKNTLKTISDSVCSLRFQNVVNSSWLNMLQDTEHLRRHYLNEGFVMTFKKFVTICWKRISKARHHKSWQTLWKVRRRCRLEKWTLQRSNYSCNMSNDTQKKQQTKSIWSEPSQFNSQTFEFHRLWNEKRQIRPWTKAEQSMKLMTQWMNSRCVCSMFFIIS